MTAPGAPLPARDGARLDHLVVWAHTLAEGDAWCRATFGVSPEPGGAHALFGTHNRLLMIGSPAFPAAYLEIIAIDPTAARPGGADADGQRRWFDMDDEALAAAIRMHGPQLTHWVARSPDVHAARAALAARGIDRGAVLAASRQTPAGLLRWQITVRADGARLFDGLLPTLIEWDGAHPAERLAPSGVALASLTLRHPEADALGGALGAIGLGGVALEGAPRTAIVATIATPKGVVVLTS